MHWRPNKMSKFILLSIHQVLLLSHDSLCPPRSRSGWSWLLGDDSTWTMHSLCLDQFWLIVCFPTIYLCSQACAWLPPGRSRMGFGAGATLPVGKIGQEWGMVYHGMHCRCISCFISWHSFAAGPWARSNKVRRMPCNAGWIYLGSMTTILVLL